MTSSAEQDESAVAAVRRGDAERYRELVERHERHVYAVAWSRLGDAALAEEATQEAFIRAYRHLWLLGDGAKFAGWVSIIARRVAINLGLRHRRELNKRKRWALENPEYSTAEKSADETDPLCTPETLRQTLAELPAAHRECLVLFYLEGKSGAEAAAALGISNPRCACACTAPAPQCAPGSRKNSKVRWPNCVRQDARAVHHGRRNGVILREGRNGGWRGRDDSGNTRETCAGEMGYFIFRAAIFPAVCAGSLAVPAAGVGKLPGSKRVSCPIISRKITVGDSVVCTDDGGNLDSDTTAQFK